ncbi:MAG: universal stress protein [Crocinitomicaceae bacterium]
MKKILVPIDFTPCSESALNYAIGIAKNTNTEIHLVHAVELDYTFTGGNLYGARLSELEMADNPFKQLKEVFERADELLVELLEVHKGEVKYKTSILEGDLVGELLAYSLENEIDLVVMGSHGVRGLNTLILGSNAQKMIRLSKVPVIVVKEKSSLAMFRSIVYTSDFREEQLNNSLNYIKTISEFYKSDLHLLYINSPNKFEESDVVDERMAKVVEDHQLKNATFSTYNSVWIEEGILKYIKKYQPDLLVINTHGYKGLKKIFHHSVAESVAHAIDIPVMIIPNH